MIKIKNENGKFYMQSLRGGWRELASNIKSLADARKMFNTNEVEMVSSTGEPFRAVEVLAYDKLYLTVKHDGTGPDGERVYFPEASEAEITRYLTDDAKRAGFNQCVVKMRVLVKDEEKPVIEFKSDNPYTELRKEYEQKGTGSKI